MGMKNLRHYNNKSKNLQISSDSFIIQIENSHSFSTTSLPSASQ
jgi:hypothetical protein